MILARALASGAGEPGPSAAPLVLTRISDLPSAAAALRTDRFDGQAFNLTGPEALGYAEAATILSAATGRPIRYLSVDDAAFIATLTDAGMPKDYAAFLASIFHPVREGWTAAVTGDVATLTGAVPRRLAEYAAYHAATLRG